MRFIFKIILSITILANVLIPLTAFADETSDYLKQLQYCYSDSTWSNEKLAECIAQAEKDYPNAVRPTMSAGSLKTLVSKESPEKPKSFALTFNVPVGQLTGCTIGGDGSNCLGLYIKAWYGFVLGTIGIIATFMIMAAGFKYLTSKGSSKPVGEAKDMIFAALTGLAIAFLSYTVLNLINPNLNIINIPPLPGIKSDTNKDK